MSEPVKDRGELNETQEGRSEFIVAGADAAGAFDAAEEVFYLMAVPVVASVKGNPPTAVTFGRNADSGALAPQPGPERVGIEALVGHRLVPAQTPEQRCDGVEIVALAGGEAECHGTAATFDDGCQLGVDPSFGPTNRLPGLAAPRIRSGLMEFDVRTIEVTQSALGPLGQLGKHERKQSACTPPAEPGVDRTPRTEVGGQIAPRHSGPQNIEDRRQHQAIILGWTTPQPPPAVFDPHTVNFFSLRHTGSGTSHRAFIFMRPLGSPLSTSAFSDFANTP